jgi:hypothetical protein
VTDEEQPTSELRAQQHERETEERRQAGAADSEAESKEHERRAEKSAYLREKLEERERSERSR